MKTVTFTCDVCGSVSPAEPEVPRPSGMEWLQVSIYPMHPPHPRHVPVVYRDTCSIACAVKLLRASAERLEELGKDG